MAEFVERFERPRLPAVITGLCEPWGAAADWDEAGLLRRFAEHRFKVGAPAGSLRKSLKSLEDGGCRRASPGGCMLGVHNRKASGPSARCGWQVLVQPSSHMYCV